MYTIQTPRLLMRPFMLEDAHGLFQLNSDPEVMRYVGNDPPFESVAAAAAFIAQYKPYEKDGYGRLSVVLRETGEFIGWSGLKYQTTEKETDVGYRFLQPYWGKGYATESAAASLVYGFEELGLQNIIGRVMPANVASKNVLEKIGLTFWKSDTCDEHPADFYRISKEAFAKRQK